ncbi:MAG: class I SAM-dependent methyltransferase [Candidatus Eisenbacteria bacterium]
MTARNEWARFFDDHAQRYDENVFTKNTVAEVDFLVDLLGISPGQSVLDVGCGTGRHAVELASRGFSVTGLDLSSGMLEEAKRRASAAGVEVAWIRADAADFALRGEFDALLCLCEGAFGLLGGGADPIGQPLAILRNASSSMKTNARALFTVLNGSALIRKATVGDIEANVFDPVALTERSECALPGSPEKTLLRERGFVPTELVLLFGLGGLEVLEIWGGTAGKWGKRTIDPDEIEIMILAGKPPEPPVPPYGFFSRR